jgi:hypothetical protein
MLAQGTANAKGVARAKFPKTGILREKPALGPARASQNFRLGVASIAIDGANFQVAKDRFQ